MLRFDERGPRAPHCAARSCAATREFFRLVENAGNIRDFDAPVFPRSNLRYTRAPRARSKKLLRRCVRHAEQTCAKIVGQEACKSGLAVDSSADRANRLEVIRSSRSRSYGQNIRPKLKIAARGSGSGPVHARRADDASIAAPFDVEGRRIRRRLSIIVGVACPHTQTHLWFPRAAQAWRAGLSKVQSVDQRDAPGMRCRLSPTADVPSHTSRAAMGTGCEHTQQTA
jgi:hypothetical protein